MTHKDLMTIANTAHALEEAAQILNFTLDPHDTGHFARTAQGMQRFRQLAAGLQIILTRALRETE